MIISLPPLLSLSVQKREKKIMIIIKYVVVTGKTIRKIIMILKEIIFMVLILIMMITVMQIIDNTHTNNISNAKNKTNNVIIMVI